MQIRKFHQDQIVKAKVGIFQVQKDVPTNMGIEPHYFLKSYDPTTKRVASGRIALPEHILSLYNEEN